MRSQSTVYQSTLPDIQQIIEARLRFFLEMRLYLADIQANKIPDEEVIIFLKDVVGIKISADHKKKNSLIEALKNNVHEQFKVYQELKKCFNIEDKKIRLCLFHKLLELYYRASFYKNEINACSADKLTLESKADFSFNERKALKSLQNLFKKIFPDEYKGIDQLITVKESGDYYFSGGSTLGDMTICWKITWKPYWYRLQSLFEEAQKLKPQLQQISTEKLQVRQDQILALFRDTGDKAITEYGERHGNIELLKKQITLYFVYCENVEFFTQLQNQSEKEKQLNELYQDAINKILLVKERLLKKLTLLGEILQHENQEKDASYNEIQATLVKLKADILDLNKNVDLKRDDEDLIESSMASVEERENELNGKIIDLGKQIDHYICIKQLAKKKEEDDRQRKIKQQIEEENKKIAEFLGEKKRLLEEYKKEVSENRRQNETQKRVKISQQSEIKSDTISNNNKFINEELKEKLGRLHKEDCDLIHSIYKIERGVKFKPVTTLITKLGGTVSEIGNGSSHKRIYLNKLYSEFYSHIDEAEEVTGGYVKPHGHARNSGELSFFNIKQIRAVFVRASITLEDIEKIKIEVYTSSSSTTANIMQVISSVGTDTRAPSLALAGSSVSSPSGSEVGKLNEDDTERKNNHTNYTTRLTVPAPSLENANIQGKGEKYNFSR